MPRKLAIFMAILATGLPLDQVTKVLVQLKLPLGSQVPLFPEILNLVHIHNKGAGFRAVVHLVNRIRLAVLCDHHRFGAGGSGVICYGGCPMTTGRRPWVTAWS